MPGARRNWIFHSPCSQRAMPRVKMAGLGFQISAQTPAVWWEADWQALLESQGRLQQTLGRFEPPIKVSVYCELKDLKVSA
ncbi:hypothetical protein PBY51_010773 [Eleginops maclovinus]|uniref:Uncharacterized protein n=1 Tax=Eleginops maclovinus TaxID=56733 RepID=A0AAN8AF13_ELEMC|nr:hypothetical protein PBY51_010773 [Eleginops maclovinus]